MTYALTIFNSPRWWEKAGRYVYDNKTHRRLDLDNWDQFVNFLRKLSERPLNGKQDAELITPAVFKPDSTRKNDNVLCWAGWAAVDVDDLVIEGNLEDVLHTRFGDWDYVVYSTASSTVDQAKFRIVFNLGEQIESARLRHFWYALNQELDSIGDAQTKDLARMYYVPANYADANNFFYVNSGEPVDLDYLLAKWPYDDVRNAQSFLDRLPPAFREQVIEYRKGKLDDTSYVWSTYADCPFWPRNMAAEYVSISSTGWYRQMYRIMIAIAGKSIEKGYNISATQIVEMCRQFDSETGNWYENRPMEVEANNALEYAYKNGDIQ
tara:strand:- start:4801 stop:5769 length:969 start_codon:yes stop_codon:yes gene_type:complete